MKQFKSSVFGESPEVEKLKEAIFYSMQNDSTLSETKVLFSQLNAHEVVDTYILNFMKEDTFSEENMLFLFNEINGFEVNPIVIKDNETKESLAVKSFMNKVAVFSRFEVLTNRIFNSGSLNAVKFLLTHFDFKSERVLELVYRNTMEVFFYVFDTFKVDKSLVSKMIKDKLENDASFFNFEIVKELVVSDDMVISDELMNYDIMKKIMIFKNFNSKDNAYKTEKELVKI